MRNDTMVPFRPLSAALVLTGALAAGAATGAAASAAGRVEVGQEAPGFSLTSSAGETYSLADLRGEKDLVLVFFRGTW